MLAFLQKERGLLRPGYRFRPIMRDDVLQKFEAVEPDKSPQQNVPVAMVK